MREKFFSVVYGIGSQLHDYYLSKIGVTPVELRGKLGKSYMQYFIEVSSGRYAIRFIDSVHLSRDDLGKEVAAEALDGLVGPEGYLGYCRKIQFVEANQENV